MVGRVFRNRAEVRYECVAVSAAERLERERRRGLFPQERALGVVLAHDVCAGTAHEVCAGRRFLHHAVMVVRTRHLAVDSPRITLEARHDLLAAEFHLRDVVRSVLGYDYRALVRNPEPVRPVALRGAVEKFRLLGWDVRDPQVAVGPVHLVAVLDGTVYVSAAVFPPLDLAIRGEQPHASASARYQRLRRTPLQAHPADVQSATRRYRQCTDGQQYCFRHFFHCRFSVKK